MGAFPNGSVDKESACNAGDAEGMGRGDPLDGNPLQYLAWEIPWTEETGRVQSMGCKESVTTEHVHIQVVVQAPNVKLTALCIKWWYVCIQGHWLSLETEIPSFLQRAIFILYVILISYSFRVNILALESPHLFI